MVNANELRIGNWIKVGGSSISTYQTYRPKKITAEYIKAIQEENIDRGQDYSLSVFQPIPLTPEILEKAGFVNDNGYWMAPDNAGYIDRDGDYILENGAGQWLPPCKYLHQLQNLHFALTGKELNIEL